MRVRFKNHTGYDRWAEIEDVTMLVRLDGTVVTSLPMPIATNACSRRKRRTRQSNF